MSAEEGAGGLAFPIELALSGSVWTEAPTLAAPAEPGEVLQLNAQGRGDAVEVQLIRRREGHSGFAWTSIHVGPLGRKDVLVDIDDLVWVDGFTPAADDLLIVRFKALKDAAVVRLEDLRLRAKPDPDDARERRNRSGPEGLEWPPTPLPAGAAWGTPEHRIAPVLLFGTFDVENYGDLLFPLLAERRLAAAGLKVAAVSPTNLATRFQDALPPLSIEDVSQLNPPGRGVLIGGGNIVHLRPTSLRDYQEPMLDRLAYAGLWLGATMLAAAYDLPIAWNAPGVPVAETSWPAKDAFWAAARAADYVSVRDEESREALGGLDQPITVLPDPAIEVSRLWPLADLEPVARAVLDKQGFGGCAGYIAVHVKERSLQGGLAELAGQLDALASDTARPIVLIAIGPCHGDDVVARQLGRMMRGPSVVLDRPSSLREVAALLACADIVVCSSLHAYITSCSYGRPGILVAAPLASKFQAFARQVERTDDIAPSWEDGLMLARGRLAQRPDRLEFLSGALSRRLDQHWTAVIAALSDPSSSRSRRLDFLRAAAAINLRRVGWPTLISGLVGPD